MKRRDPARTLAEAAHNEIAQLKDFQESEKATAENLLALCRLRHIELSDDEYRAMVFFINEEYRRTPGALSLLYEARHRITRQLPPVSRENAVALSQYRFRTFAAVLIAGGYYG